ncbi:hypothetical protein [Modestobacter sp. SSW1-42]|uniref:hypothetical protein n=1 Tax=Modestobacter sp. SSW1-42 TaxID=596372 RepID=UPI00398657D3
MAVPSAARSGSQCGPLPEGIGVAWKVPVQGPGDLDRPAGAEQLGGAGQLQAGGARAGLADRGGAVC